METTTITHDYCTAMFVALLTTYTVLLAAMTIDLFQDWRRRAKKSTKPGSDGRRATPSEVRAGGSATGNHHAGAKDITHE